LGFSQSPADSQHESNRMICHRGIITAGCNGRYTAERANRFNIYAFISHAAAGYDL
jgi:hypothetical protein